MDYVVCGSFNWSCCWSTKIEIQELCRKYRKMVHCWTLEILSAPQLFWRGLPWIFISFLLFCKSAAFLLLPIYIHTHIYIYITNTKWCPLKFGIILRENKNRSLIVFDCAINVIYRYICLCPFHSIKKNMCTDFTLVGNFCGFYTCSQRCRVACNFWATLFDAVAFLCQWHTIAWGLFSLVLTLILKVHHHRSKWLILITWMISEICWQEIWQYGCI